MMHVEHQHGNIAQMEELIRNRIAPLFYSGIQMVLALMHRYEDDQGYLCVVRLMIRLSSLVESPQSAIEDFIQEVSPLFHGNEYGSIMQERLDIALNANAQESMSG